MNYFYITDIAAGSFAEKAGLKAGDIIKAINGKSIYSQTFWEMYLALLSSNSKNISVVLLKTKNGDKKKNRYANGIDRTARYHQDHSKEYAIG